MASVPSDLCGWQQGQEEKEEKDEATFQSRSPGMRISLTFQMKILPPRPFEPHETTRNGEGEEKLIWPATLVSLRISVRLAFFFPPPTSKWLVLLLLLLLLLQRERERECMELLGRRLLLRGNRDNNPIR